MLYLSVNLYTKIRVNNGYITVQPTYLMVLFTYSFG